MEGLEQGGVTAVLVGLVLALSKVITKKAGTNLETEIAVIKAQVEALQESADDTKESTDKLCDMFQGFREEVRLQWERDKVREATIREIKNESTG
jgi:peptidoglycan hydrolase CwlO-like protein